MDLWGFFQNNSGAITAIMAVLGPSGAAFGVFYRWKFRSARKKADSATENVEYLKGEISSLSTRLGKAKTKLEQCSPDSFLQRIETFKDSASSEDLQKAASDYFDHQNEAITTAAGYLAEKALLLEGEDGPSALMEAKRWLTLGLAATPRNQHQNELMAEINNRLNALELGLPEL